MEAPKFKINPEAPDKEAALLFARYELLTLPVIGTRGDFKGVITIDGSLMLRWSI
jgi:Mg/Co/Ni transporter MgtE